MIALLQSSDSRSVFEADRAVSRALAVRSGRSKIPGWWGIANILFCALVCLPTTATAMSGRDYLTHCHATTVYDRAQCMGYLDALLLRDAQADYRTDVDYYEGQLVGADAKKLAPYCLPSGIQLPLLRDVVVRRLAQLPAMRLNQDAGPLIRGILARTYPSQVRCGD